jgi:hypothetical protein
MVQQTPIRFDITTESPISGNVSRDSLAHTEEPWDTKFTIGRHSERRILQVVIEHPKRKSRSGNIVIKDPWILQLNR